MKEFSRKDLMEIYEKSHFGCWKMELVQGEAVRMYADEAMERLLGVDADVSPEECCAFFKSHIHPDDYPMITEYLNNMLDGDAEILYRYLHPVKGEMMVRCNGVRIKTDGEAEILAGYHREIADVIRIGSDEKLENQLVRKNRNLQEEQIRIEEYNRNLLDQAACGIVFYTLPNRDNLYMNAEALRVYGASNLEEAKANMEQVMRQAVYPNHRVLHRLIELRTTGGYVDYECTITTPDGKINSVLAHTEVITNPQAERSVYTTFLDVSENKALKNDKSILDALSADYAFVYLCDLEEDTISEVKTYSSAEHGSEETEKERFLHGMVSDNESSYTARMKLYYQNFVDAGYSADFEEKLDATYLMSYLPAHQGRFAFRYRIRPNETGIENFEINIVQLKDKEGFKAVMGFRIIDDIIQEEKKQKKKLQEINARQEEQLNTIGGLSNAYFAVYWVNLQSNSCKPVKNIPFFEQVAGGLETTDEVVDAFISLCVKTEDRKKMAAFTNWHKLPELLRGNDVMVEEFHGEIMPWEWCRASWIVAARDADGWPVNVLFAVEDISASIAERRQREQEHRLLEVQNRVISGLSQEYTTVWFVTKNGKSCVKYQDTLRDSVAREKEFSASQEIDYTYGMQLYIKKYVCEEEQEKFARKSAYEVVLQEIHKNAVYSVIYKRKYKDKKEYFQVTYTLVDRTGESNDFVVGFKNVDDVVMAEHQRNEALSAALAEAEYANHAKTQFLNNMSHDIRTPMNAVIGFTSLAATHIDDKEKVKEYLRKIETSSEHLLSLINDVLDMSRIESGKVKIDEKPLHLPDLLHDIRTIIQPTISSKQLDFLIDTVDVVDEDIIADKLRLTQVLLNIIGNGVKFNKTGGLLSLRVKQEKKAPKGYARYRFIIKDTGIGISKEFQKHIFENFSREESSTVSGIQGTGLGLSITKKIVDMMGGTIRLKSEEGVGSEFDVCLTFKINGEKKVYEKITSLQGLRVLVADDDTDTCLSISSMLTEIGMRSEWTVSGKEAVVRARHAVDMGDEFYAYIIDWLMPDMNGIETVRRIRRVIGESSPIIILTAYDWSDVEEEAREAGVTAFCEKPLFMSELRDILSQPVPVAKEEKECEIISPQGKRILLVEDNELNQEIAVEILKEAGFKVEIANDGRLAVEKMRTSEPGQYDIILMDIQMPIMNGYDATRQIRAMDREHCRQIPIIAMTANAFEEDRELAVKAGMNGYLAKPIQIDRMLETIRNILK